MHSNGRKYKWFVRFGKLREETIETFAEQTFTSEKFLRAVVTRKIDPYIDFQIRKRSSKNLRSISSPIPQLYHAQKSLLGKLDISWVHENAHAYVPGRSVITCATPHLGMKWGVKLDLKDFFSHVTAHHIESALFPQLSNDVAWFYSRLSTRSPETVRARLPKKLSRRWPSKALVFRGSWGLKKIDSILDEWETVATRSAVEPDGRTISAIERSKKTIGYLPQGAPTSGLMSNIAFRRVDRDLTQIAENHGLTFTRYSDDMLFSSNVDNFSMEASLRLIKEVRICLAYYSFTINNQKTRIMKPGGRMLFLGLLLDGEKLRLTKERRDSVVGAFRDLAKFTLLDQESRFSSGQGLRLARNKDKKSSDAVSYFDMLSGYARWVRSVDAVLFGKLQKQFVLDQDSLVQYTNQRDILHVAEILDTPLHELILKQLPEPSARDWNRS